MGNIKIFEAKYWHERRSRIVEQRNQLDLTSMNIPKSILYLAWPVVLRMSLQMIVGIVDLAFVGSIGPAAIASVGISNNLMWFIISATTAFSVGTTALVARNIGAKDYEEAQKVARQSIAITFTVATVIGILSFIFSKQIIHIMIAAQKTPDPLIIQYGTLYFQILAASFPFFFTLMVLNGILQGSGDMKTPLKVMAFVNLFNVLFDWLLIFGIGPFPEMGVAGAALASTAARILAFTIAFYILLKGKTRFKIKWPKKFRFDWGIIKQIADIGLPAAGEQLIRNSGTTFLAMIVAGLGTAALAANQIVMRGISIANMPAFGFSMAATTLVGQNLGAKKRERAEKAGYIATKMAALFMLNFGTLIFALAKPISMFFTNEPEVIHLSVIALRIVSVSLPFMGVLLTFAGALRGAGDTKWVMYITAMGVWGIRVALAYLLGIIFKLGFSGIWLAFALDFVGRAVMYYYRYSQGKWKEINLRKNLA